MEKPIIHISPEVKAACPELRLGCIMATVEVQAENPELWNEISNISEDIHERLRLEDIARLAPVKASRQAYKALGKIRQGIVYPLKHCFEGSSVAWACIRSTMWWIVSI